MKHVMETRDEMGNEIGDEKRAGSQRLDWIGYAYFDQKNRKAHVVQPVEQT